MIRITLAYKKPLPRGSMSIPEDEPEQKDNPPTGTASHATLNELQQAAQVGHLDTRGSNQWESRDLQSAPVDIVVHANLRYYIPHSTYLVTGSTKFYQLAMASGGSSDSVLLRRH